MTTNRYSLIIAAIVIAALAALTVSMARPPRSPAASSLSSFYQPVEQVRGARSEAAAAQQAYLDQRQGEQTTAAYIDPQQAYLRYRQGEWNAGVTSAQAYMNYRRGEWSGK